ncbi:MAG: 3-oxoacyl-(Acyl-carrier-protein) synthase, partial [Verrucomicrobiota bacterium]
RLGLKTSCACFDINLGCSQYVYGLSVAHSMINSGVASRALVLTGDTLSRTLHPNDRAVVPLLADGGSATLVGRTEAGSGFLGFKLGTDGSGHRHLMIPAGGFREPKTAETAREVMDADGNTRSRETLYMNGAAIFHFSISVVPPTVEALLADFKLRVDDIHLFLFHQANKYMLDYLVKKMKIPPQKTFFHLEDVGNTSGTTVPIVLREAMLAGKVEPGKLILLMGFGVGLSWGATLIRWPGGVNPA